MPINLHINKRREQLDAAKRRGASSLVDRLTGDRREESLVRVRPPQSTGLRRPGSRGGPVSVEAGPTPGGLTYQDVQLPPVLTDFPVIVVSADYPEVGTAGQLMNVMNVVRATSLGDPVVYAGVSGVADLSLAPTIASFGVVIMGGKPPLTTAAAAPLTFATTDFNNGASSVNRTVTLCAPNSPSAMGGRLIEPFFAPGSLGGLIFLPFAYRGGNLRATPIVSNTRGISAAVRVTGGSYEFSTQVLAADTPLTATLAGLLERRIGG